MSRAEIKEKLVDILNMVIGSASETQLDDSAELINDLGLNSVGVLYIVVGIEEVFNIMFDDVGFADFETIGDVIDYIERKTAL